MKKRVVFVTLIFSVSVLFFSGCHSPQYKYPTIKIETYYGDIIVELYPEKAPKTVNAFLSFVDSGYFKNSSFYRVLKEEDQPSSAFRSELIQGGIYRSNPRLLTQQKGVPLETTKASGLKHLDGTISLARTTPNSGSTEFFICVGDQPAYDYGGGANDDGQGYSAFGRVIKGMRVVLDIHKEPNSGTDYTPAIKIKNIIWLNKPGNN